MGGPSELRAVAAILPKLGCLRFSVVNIAMISFVMVEVIIGDGDLIY